jgi:hypothetical protein
MCSGAMAFCVFAYGDQCAQTFAEYLFETVFVHAISPYYLLVVQPNHRIQMRHQKYPAI